MKQESNEKSECCPKFDPAPWDGKVFEWKNKKFIKDQVYTILYMPINFGSVMQNFDKLLKKADSEISSQICLSEHTSKWNMDVYLEVKKEVPGAENIELDGTYVSKVYEGPFRDASDWQKDFKYWCNTQDYKLSRSYLWYTTCPKCAKKYGKNYTVIIGKIEK